LLDNEEGASPEIMFEIVIDLTEDRLVSEGNNFHAESDLLKKLTHDRLFWRFICINPATRESP
jgi:hypothetical protein